MKLDHHPRAAMANEQGARGFVGFSMPSVLRQNALESPVLDLRHHVLGESIGNIAIYQASQTRLIPNHTGWTQCARNNDRKGAKGAGMWKTRHLKESINRGQGYLLFGSNSAVT